MQRYGRDGWIIRSWWLKRAFFHSSSNKPETVTTTMTTSTTAAKKCAPLLKSPSTLLSLDQPDVWPRSPLPNFATSDVKNHSTEQTAALIDGKSIADDIKAKIADEISEMKNSIGKTPGLGVIGKRMDSQAFVRTKLKLCSKVGISTFTIEIPEDCTESQVLGAISQLNENPLVHGIIVQLPLPKHLAEEKIISAVHVDKDVDGFHPLNMGNLAIRGREPLFIPCASKGCIELLLRHGVEIAGKKAVVVGRGKIVGLPTSLLLQRHHATVSVVHAFTKNPDKVTREADIVVADVGVPNFVRGHWLKPGSIVIDTGTNSIKDSSSLHGYRLIGDVCYEEAITNASAVTPVPGGVGPITIAMLLANTLDSAKRVYKCI